MLDLIDSGSFSLDIGMGKKGWLHSVFLSTKDKRIQTHTKKDPHIRKQKQKPGGSQREKRGVKLRVGVESR
jgi:hypothetical protein